MTTTLKHLGKLYLLAAILVSCSPVAQQAATIPGSSDAVTTSETQGLTDTSGIETVGSTSKIGNPSLDINAMGSAYLIKTNASDNLAQIADAAITPVIVVTDQSAAAPLQIPQVQSFRVGPHNEMVIVFSEVTDWNGSACLMLYSSQGQEQCILSEGFTLESDIHFDLAGRVYFGGVPEDTKIPAIIRWHPDSGQLENMLSLGLQTIKQWRVHADGRVFLLTRTSSKAYFRMIDTSGKTMDFGSPFVQVVAFSFLDASRLLVQTSNGDDGIGKPILQNVIMDLTTYEAIQTLDFNGGNIETMQKDSLGHVYVEAQNRLVRILPGAAREISTGLGVINLFKVFDNTLYLAGIADGQAKLSTLNLTDPGATPVDQYTNQQVFDLVAGESGAVYFDAKDVNTGLFAVMRFDLASGTKTTIDSLSDQLILFQSIRDTGNYSY